MSLQRLSFMHLEWHLVRSPNMVAVSWPTTVGWDEWVHLRFLPQRLVSC